jgi:hypothetical protein
MIRKSDNPALEGSSPKNKSFAFCQKKEASLMKKADLSNMFKNASKSVCISIVAVFPDTVSLTPSTSSVMMTPENTEQDADDSAPADKGNI